MQRKSLVFLVLSLFLIGAIGAISGCNSLRFAPSEAQKQIAFDTYQTAQAVNTTGAAAASPAAQKLVTGTAAALAYTGMPADPVIPDYDAAAAQATADAAARPTAVDVIEAADEGLSLFSELAIALGLGGLGYGGKKLSDWLALAKQRSAALKEVVKNNELFKSSALAANNAAAVDLFKQAQAAQSPETKVLVTELKAGT